jgi:V8-like Glu-specific endopeptidase
MRAQMRRLAVACLGLTFAVLAAPGTAHADDAVGISLDLAQQAAAVEHWTPDRMLSAVSGDGLLLGRDLSDVTSEVEQGLESIVPGISLPVLGLGGLDLGGLFGGGSGSGNGGSLYTKSGAVVHTSGKVFFTMDGTNYVCSGSSTAAANRSLVQTAGHCVNAGPGSWATNFVFVPAYRDGQAPYGVFPAARLHTTDQWAGSGDLSYDVGYAVVSPVGGRPLADIVGAQGIGFNLARGANMHAFGYPAAAPYDGSKLAWCKGTVSSDTQGTSDQGMTCNMTGGSSGGPWFASFNESTGIGTLNSLNSFKYVTLGLLDDGRMYGPYFGSVIQSLYNTAQQ